VNETRPRLAGLAIRGYRDVRQPTFLGPWSRINIFGGVNNAGKSALLNAVEQYLSPLLEGGSIRPPNTLRLEPLDVPQVPEGHEAPSLEIGMGIAFPGGDVGRGLIYATSGSPPPAEMDFGVITNTLAGEAFLDPMAVDNADEPLRWIWFGQDGKLSARQAEQLDQDTQAGQALRSITSHGYSGEVSWSGVLQKVINGCTGPGRVVSIPSMRRITVTDHRESKLPSTSGEGLPGMLLSLIAPQAVEYRQARARLATINSFVTRVMGRPAELLVPHDGGTVHLAMEERVLPLSHLGSGVEQVVLLATICTEYTNTLILMEEPDLYLHPTLQRQLLSHLREQTDNTYLIATHSAAMLDTDYANVFRVDWTRDDGTTARLISGPHDRAALATSLGFRASDLVQANAVIWVEGPSDRIYVKRWLELEDIRLTEGVHYSFVLYGGRLAEHLTAAEFSGTVDKDVVDRFLNITRINRHAIFLMDSDLTEAGELLAGYKTRLTRNFQDSIDGLAWTTKGTMIENYVDPDVYLAAYKDVHPRKRPTYDGSLRMNPFTGGVKQPQKVAIAENAARRTDHLPARGDLQARVHEVARFLQRVNDLPTAQLTS